jgi:hypothetical protein
MPATGERRVQLLAGGLAGADAGLLAVRRCRPQLTKGFLGPADADLSTWSAGVIGAYTLAQLAVAVRPSAEAARHLVTLRLVLIGGDLMLARRGRTVDRRWGVATAVGNSLFATALLLASRGAQRSARAS